MAINQNFASQFDLYYLQTDGKEVRDYLLDHFLGNNIFNNCQYGFFKGRSTVLQLLHIMDECTECLEQGGHWGQINSIYTDFEKAFDKVPQQQLLQKLKL